MAMLPYVQAAGNEHLVHNRYANIFAQSILVHLVSRQSTAGEKNIAGLGVCVTELKLNRSMERVSLSRVLLFAVQLKFLNLI